MNGLNINGYGMTDVGPYRFINEDYFTINTSFFILADGIGGHNAGEIASKLAVDTLEKILTQCVTSVDFENRTIEEIQKTLINSLSETNKNIVHKSNQHIQYRDMGTTIVLALFQKPNIIHIANIGDSRAYIFRNNSLQQLSEDHTITASMLRKGMISKKNEKIHPFRHQLSQSLGINNIIEPHIISKKIQLNDRILLCSDGLWNVLTDKEIIEIIQKNCPLKFCCEELIKKAKSNNSMDNITCIMISIIE